MLEMIQSANLLLADRLLGWLLALPSDLALLLVALITSLLMRGVRWLTTNQELLARIEQDRKVLKARIRAARARGDKAEAERARALGTRVALRALTQEGVPLLATLIPVALLATWCWFRLEFNPVREAEPVTLSVYTPASAIGIVAHVIPQDGLQSPQWVQPVVATTNRAGEKTGVARWTLQGLAREQPYPILIRSGERTLEQALLVGGPRYAPDSTRIHEDGWISQMELKPVKLFGIVPGMPAHGLPAWLAGYLILVLALMPVTRRLTRVR